MLIRTMVLAAFAITPLISSPVSVSAQEQALDRATTSTAQAQSVAGWENNRAANQPTGLPAGIARVFGDGTLPPGISWMRSAPEPEAEPPAPDEDPVEDDVEQCETEPELVVVNGQLMEKDCNGNLTPVG